MSSYTFSDAAVRDLDEICEYIAIENSRAASQLFDKIRQKCKLVASFPNMGKTYPKLDPSLRGFVIDDYIVFYYSSSDGINIARIISGYRDIDDLF